MLLLVCGCQTVQKQSDVPIFEGNWSCIGGYRLQLKQDGSFLRIVTQNTAHETVKTITSGVASVDGRTMFLRGRLTIVEHRATEGKCNIEYNNYIQDYQLPVAIFDPKIGCTPLVDPPDIQSHAP